MKDEALKLALEALETELAVDMNNGAEVGEAAELMCEAITAIKQALAAQQEHEPENEPYVSLASVQEPVAWMFDCGNGGRMYAEDLDASVGWLPLYTTPPAAQPAVPDAIHHTDLSEHPQYIEGWNDCRAEMLKGMK